MAGYELLAQAQRDLTAEQVCIYIPVYYICIYTRNLTVGNNDHETHAL